MPDKSYTNLPLSFEKGINEFYEASMLPIGASKVLRNWVPDPGGELRVRTPWSKGSTTSAPSPRKNVGTGYFTRLLTPGIVQGSTVVTADTGGLGTATLTPAWPAATGKGSLLVLVIGISGRTAGWTVTPPAGWTTAVTEDPGSGTAPLCRIYYIANSASRSGQESISCTGLSTQKGVAAQLFEISGILATSPLDVTASATSTTLTPSSGTTGTTGRAVNFALAVLCDTKMESQTSPTNNFLQYSETQLDVASTAVDLTFGVYYKPTTAIGTQSCSVTTATSNASGGCIAVFKGWFSGTPAAGQTEVTEFLCANNATTNYGFYAVDRDTIDSDTWSSLGSVTVADPTQLVAWLPD